MSEQLVAQAAPARDCRVVVEEIGQPFVVGQSRLFRRDATRMAAGFCPASRVGSSNRFSSTSTRSMPCVRKKASATSSGVSRGNPCLRRNRRLTPRIAVSVRLGQIALMVTPRWVDTRSQPIAVSDART